MKRAGEELGRPRTELADAEAAFERLMLELPNLPHPAVPVGPDERDNRRRAHGRRGAAVRLHAAAALGPRPGARHHRLRARREDLRLALLRAERRGRAAAARADHLDARPAHREHGYVEVYPPAMVKRECLVGTGNLPKFGDNLYRDAEEDFWFVPTAEVPVTNLYRDEILDARPPADPPRRLHAVLPAREDVRGPRRARHQARPPVRQGRDGEVRAPGRVRRRARSRCSPTPRTSAVGSGSATASSRCAPATCASPRPASTTSRCGRRAAASGSRSAPARTSATSRRAARASASAPWRGEAGARAHAERLRPGAAARPDRRARDLPARRRQRHRAGGAAALRRGDVVIGSATVGGRSLLWLRSSD